MLMEGWWSHQTLDQGGLIRVSTVPSLDFDKKLFFYIPPPPPPQHTQVFNFALNGNILVGNSVIMD